MGPLHAIIQSLGSVRSEYAIVCPVDMPFLRRENYLDLVSELLHSDLASYAINGWLTSLLFAVRIDGIEQIIADPFPANSRVDDLFRRSHGMSIIHQELSKPFVNINALEDLDQVDKLPEQSSWGEMERIDTRSLSSLTHHSCAHYQEELKIWDSIKQVRKHIIRDAEKLGCLFE